MKTYVTLLVALTVAVEAWADRATEIARIHVEAIGGRQRIAALAALRMTGVVEAGTQRVNVTLIAARPARLRAETQLGSRTIVQATDGVSAPWQFDSAAPAPGYSLLGEAAAERFLADAQFDDPLVQWEGRRDRLEFAGEVEIEGRKFLRILVVRALTENLFVVLDPRTYFIAFRVQELRKGGKRVELVTRYEDYRPVNGVLVAHAVTLFEDGKRTQQARFEAIEANPVTTDGMFAPPSGLATPTATATR